MYSDAQPEKGGNREKKIKIKKNCENCKRANPSKEYLFKQF
jgi:hypothetical protein